MHLHAPLAASPSTVSHTDQAPGAPPYPRLFEPLRQGRLRLKNRIAHASISTRLGSPGQLSDGYLAYCRTRARGGAALLVTEPLRLHPGQGAARLATWDDSQLPELQRLAEAVESHGCRLIGQVQDPGRGRHVPGRSQATLAPSALPDDLSGTMPRAMSTAEVGDWVAMVAERAWRLQRAGWSGIELSACHGHLFHLFLSPRANRREDAYGGDAAGRSRWLVEMVNAVHAACGEHFAVGLKLPGDDGLPDSIPPAEAARLLAALLDGCRPDYLAFAQGAHAHTLEMHLPDAAGPRMPYAGLIRSLAQQARGVPVMALGRITDPAEAEALLGDPAIALIGLGRPLITDAQWPHKAAAGRAEAIRACVSCNTCWRTIVSDRPIACDNNPALALRVEDEPLPPATAQRHVVVVGSGIAGLEAAWVAAARGHRVSLLGASAEVGGKTRLAATLPALQSLSSVYDHQLLQAQAHGVALHLGRAARIDDVLALSPDLVLLATGATPLWPMELPASLQADGLVPDLPTLCGQLVHVHQRQPGTAVLWDLDPVEATYAVVERLAALFEQVVLLTPFDAIAGACSLVTRQSVLRRLHHSGVRVHTQVRPRWRDDFEDSAALDLDSVYGGPAGRIDGVALLTYATPRRPNDTLLAPLRAAGLTVHPLGDCQQPGDTLSATAQGFQAGRTA